MGTSVLDPGPGSGREEGSRVRRGGEAGGPHPLRQDAPPGPAPADSISPAVPRSPLAGGGYAAYLAANREPTRAFSHPAPPGAPAATGRQRRRRQQ